MTYVLTHKNKIFEWLHNCIFLISDHYFERYEYLKLKEAILDFFFTFPSRDICFHYIKKSGLQSLYSTLGVVHPPLL